MQAKEAMLQFGQFGKNLLTGAQASDTVYHSIKAGSGGADVTYTSASGEVIANQILVASEIEWDIFRDLVVNSGSVYAYSAKPV